MMFFKAVFALYFATIALAADGGDANEQADQTDYKRGMSC
jgi:hypothetical protein